MLQTYARGIATVWMVCVKMFSSRTIIYTGSTFLIGLHLEAVIYPPLKHLIDELVPPNAQLFVQEPWPLPLLRSLEKQKIP
jgi:hypothetical protein